MVPSTAEQPLANQVPLAADGAPPPGAEVLLRRLANCLAHHVNNALTGVIGYLGLSLRDAAGKGHLHDHLQAGLACAYQAAEAVKRLAAFASQTLPMGTLAPVSLRRLAQEVAAKVQGGPRVVVVDGADGLVLGNADLLRTVLEQLVRNAVEAMPRGGTLTLRPEDAAGRGRLHISDTGQGFSDDAAAHLFDPFWTSKVNGHLGLALVLCRDAVRAQGGTLTVASSPGSGTTVTLSLLAPVAVTEKGEPATTVVDDGPTALSPSSGTIVPALI
jgi:signal transduction histidine kinase